MYFKSVFPIANKVTGFTLQLYVIMRLLVSAQPILCNSCVTNTTVHSCVVVSNVVLEHVSSLEFFLTHMTGGLFYLVILQEVFVETTFVTEIFATFMTCDSRDFLRVGVHCGMSLV